MTERITFSLPDEMAEKINSQLSYGDNRSDWIRDAIREKLERDGASAGQESRPGVGSAETEVEDAAAKWDELLQRWRDATADQPPKTSHGQAAVERVLVVLREDGPLKTQTARERVYEHHTDDWPSSRDMWQSIQRYFDEIPGIEKGEYAMWDYAGDEELRRELV